jgi:pimeloyl-ACP methyl ester carboxylesterase
MSARSVHSSTNPEKVRITMSDLTVVLVHGAFADASGFRRLYDEMHGDNLKMVAPPNPLRGMSAGDGEYIKGVIAEIDGSVLLVGHSYGGAVITAAGTADNVVGLVYIAGFAPDEGETLTELQSRFPAPPMVSSITPHHLPDGGEEFTIAPEGFQDSFCADLPDRDAAFYAITQRPLSALALSETAQVAAWRSRRSWAVVPTADRCIDPGVHRFSYDRMGAEITEIEGGSHAVMISHPHEVAEVVRRAVKECSVTGAGTSA